MAEKCYITVEKPGVFVFPTMHDDAELCLVCFAIAYIITANSCSWGKKAISILPIHQKYP